MTFSNDRQLTSLEQEDDDIFATVDKSSAHVHLSSSLTAQEQECNKQAHLKGGARCRLDSSLLLSTHCTHSSANIDIGK